MKVEKDFFLALPLVSSILWALGGSGVLFVRRYLMPVVICLSVLWFLSNINWKKWFLSPISMALLMGATTLPYGKYIESQNWLMLCVVGLAYSVAIFPLFFIKTRWWLIFLTVLPLAGFIFGVGMCNYWSNWDWKIAELIVGFCVGLPIVIWNYEK